MYLDKLPQGIDSITDQPISAGDILNNPRLAKCFQYVSGVLETVIANGGQVVLPFVGGLYAPDQGWFPGECSGHFETDSKHLIVTTGLGGTTPVPRFYNRPEVAVIYISPST